MGTIQFWPRAPTSRLYIAPSNAVDFISLCLCLCYMPSGKVAPDGAGNGIRTRDLKLGRLALYQLSYSRSATADLVFGGEGRIRTSEGIAGRFTVCSLWPLGNLSSGTFQCNLCSGPDPARAAAALPPGQLTGALRTKTRVSADGESRTRDLLITSQLLYQLSYIGSDPETFLFIQQYASCQRDSIAPALILDDSPPVASRIVRASLTLLVSVIPKGEGLGAQTGPRGSPAPGPSETRACPRCRWRVAGRAAPTQ